MNVKASKNGANAVAKFEKGGQRLRVTRFLHVAGTATLLLLLAGQLAAQDDFSGMSDRQFVDFVRDMRESADLAVTPGSDAPRLREKCGFGVSMEAARRLPIMAPTEAAELHALMSPTAMQVSIVSPSGKFRIHFDTTGRHTPALIDGALNSIPGTAWAYADSTARIFDEVYQKEVVEMGFNAPPFLPGDSEYQIYILEYNGTYYGQTRFTDPIPNSGTLMPLYATFMEVDNNFREYATTGLDGLRVTAAHEFHHMVQLGSYGLWWNDRWWHEMTSTYFEEVCYPFINDYAQYVRDFAKNTQLPWYQWSPNGYEIVLWPLWLQRQYDPAVFTEAWVLSRQVEPLTAMRNAIRDHSPLGGDMAADLCSWAEANFFTGYRAERQDPVIYDDAAMLSTMRFASTVELLGEHAQLTNILNPLGSHYLRVFSGVDTLSFVVSNIDLPAAIERSTTGVEYAVDVRRGDEDGYTPLSNGWSYRFSATKENALCISLLEGGTAAAVERTAPFPNPFNPREFSRMQFPVPRNLTVNRVDLLIYSASMDLMRRQESTAVELGDDVGAFVAWDGRGDNGNFLSSGIYIYYIKYNGGSITGKFAVVVR